VAKSGETCEARVVKTWRVALGVGIAVGGGFGISAAGCVPGIAAVPPQDAALDATAFDGNSAPDTSTSSTDSSSDGATSTPTDSSTPPSDAGSDSASASDSGIPDALAEDASDAGLPLPAIEPGHLKVWLTADRGVTCTSTEGVTVWADQSGNGRNATNGSHKGPECPTTGHALNGTNLLYFSAPGTTAPYFDETLDLPLEFLNGTEFTIFVVERRWEDSPAHGPNRMLLGTDYPYDGSTACPGAGDLITFGYVYYDGFPALDYESQCYSPASGTRGRAPDASVLPPSPIALDMLWLFLEAGAGPTVWQNGVKINGGGSSGGPGVSLLGGSIGRAFANTSDNRFIGDIAEVVIFDVGITDAERLEMEGYFNEHWNLQ
jgi:hypothetical protein